MKFKSFISICIIFFIALNSDAKLGFSHEITIRTIRNFTKPSDVIEFFNQANLAQIKIIHLAVKQDEDDELVSGQVFFASKIAPIAPGYQSFDVLALAVDEAHKRGIKLYAWMPQFHDQVAVRAHSEWQMMHLKDGSVVPYVGEGFPEYFVNPMHPDVQAYERNLILEVVRNYDIDGIDLDWIRFDGIEMDMGPYSRNLAMQELHIDPVNLNFEDSADYKLWNDWRGKKIADYIKTVQIGIQSIKKNVKLGAFILPPEFTEVGQNLSFFSQYLDEVMPMGYWRDWDFSADWVAHKLVSDVAKKINETQTTTRLKPTIGITEPADETLQVLQEIRAQFPEIMDCIWFTYWDWNTHLIQTAASY